MCVYPVLFLNQIDVRPARSAASSTAADAVNPNVDKRAHPIARIYNTRPYIVYAARRFRPRAHKLNTNSAIAV